MIPASLRRIENLHIFCWLVKDICWVSDFKSMGMVMILPTIGVAIWMTFRFRKEPADLVYNLAVTLWIMANSTWMIGEFYFNDGTRPIARIFFASGLLVLGLFYGIRALRRYADKSRVD